jgi:hypothetical protein
MSEYMSDIDTPTPDKSKLTAIPYDSEVLLCNETLTRWREVDGELVRDFQGEEEWKEMAAYVDKTYNQVFMEVYQYSVKGQNA